MNVLVYESLYHLLFVAHAFCASFVLAGSLWLVGHGVLGLTHRSDAQLADRLPVGNALRDLLPFVLGLAITFGVGPLLFIQLLDGRAFYSAAILLSHRFMAILPALIVGFYLLYVQKTDWRLVTSRAGRLLIPAIATACFAYTGWSWAELRLLAQAPEQWPEVFRAGPLVIRNPDAPLRLLAITGVGLQTTALLLLARLRGEEHVERRRRVALVQCVSYLLFATVPLFHSRGASTDDGGSLTLASSLIVVGLAHLALWLPVIRRRSEGRVAPIAVAVLVQITLWSLIRRHHGANSVGDVTIDAASAQGFSAFAVGLIGVVISIGFAIRSVRRELSPST